MWNWRSAFGYTKQQCTMQPNNIVLAIRLLCRLICNVHAACISYTIFTCQKFLQIRKYAISYGFTNLVLILRFFFVLLFFTWKCKWIFFFRKFSLGTGKCRVFNPFRSIGHVLLLLLFFLKAKLLNSLNKLTCLISGFSTN